MSRKLLACCDLLGLALLSRYRRTYIDLGHTVAKYKRPGQIDGISMLAVVGQRGRLGRHIRFGFRLGGQIHSTVGMQGALYIHHRFIFYVNQSDGKDRRG